MARKSYLTSREQIQEGYEDYLAGIETNYEDGLNLTSNERKLMLERNTQGNLYEEGGEFYNIL